MVTHDRYFLDSVTNRSWSWTKVNYTAIRPITRISGAEGAAPRYGAGHGTQKTVHLKGGAGMDAAAPGPAQPSRRPILRGLRTLRDQKGPEADQNVELDSVSSRLGRTTVELESISKAFGDKVLMKDFTYIFLKMTALASSDPTEAESRR